MTSASVCVSQTGRLVAAHATPKQRWLAAGTVPMLAWVILWLGINSSPEVLIQTPYNTLDWLHWLRTVAPLLILFTFTPVVLWQHGEQVLPRATKLWLAYGLVGTATCLLSPEPLAAAYWAACYLAVFAGMAAYLNGPDRLRRAIQLNWLTWTIAICFLIVLLFLARDALSTGEDVAISAYSINTRVPEVLGMPMSRASGMARFAAVGAVVSFVLVWRTRSWQRMACVITAMICGFLVWLFQSRGAMIGLGAAVAFVMLFCGKWPRAVGITLLIVLALAAAGRLVSEERYSQIMSHLTRGQDPEAMLSMSGRTRVWQHAWEFALANPLGAGPQADRFFLDEHVHNTCLYALMEAGFLGAALFMAGLAWAWIMFFRAVASDMTDLLGQRTTLIQVGAVLAFFTIRGIPEVSGAMYSVDLMLMLPALAYLGLMDRLISSRRTAG